MKLLNDGSYCSWFSLNLIDDLKAVLRGCERRFRVLLSVRTDFSLRKLGPCGGSWAAAYAAASLRVFQAHCRNSAEVSCLLLPPAVMMQVEVDQQALQLPQAAIVFSKLRDNVQDLDEERAMLSARLQRSNRQLEQLSKVQNRHAGVWLEYL